MVYRYKRSKRKYGVKKRKTYSRRRRSGRNPMQKMASAGIRMKYTKVFTPVFKSGQNVCQGTICLAGGRGPVNQTAPPTINSDLMYTTLFDVNPDSKTRLDMKLYQQFCIYGVGVKFFFAEPTTIDASPVQLALSYSPNQCINPALDSDRMQAMSSYQTMPCNQNKSVNRYYKLAYTKKKLGIDYANTDNFPDFANNTTSLYGGQLPAGTGPSLHYKVFRNTASQQGVEGPSCRMQITYYIRYRGTRGNNSLVQ